MTNQKIFKTFGIATLVLSTIALGGLANASSILLFNTGVDGTGTPLPDGTSGDPHYTLVGVPGGTSNTLVRTSLTGSPIPPWLPDDGISAWIGPNNDNQLDAPAGLFDYRTTFDLTGYNPAQVSLLGQWAADNEGIDILINGVSTGNNTGGNPASFTFWSPFSISSGFVSGINTLDFIVNNDPYGPANPTGLRTELDLTITPEPESFMMLAIGLVGLGIGGGRWRSARARRVERNRP